MRKLIVSTFVTLDGVMQAPGGPEEDPTGGLTYGGWTVNYWDDMMGQVMGGYMANHLSYYWAGRHMKSLRLTGHTLKMTRVPIN